VKKFHVVKDEAFLNMYEKFEDKVKEFDEKSVKNFESNLKSNIGGISMNGQDEIGFIGKVLRFFGPDKHFLEPGQKKHHWHGKFGVFDSKFQDTREYKD
jgi:hypothetical protein